MKEVGPPNTSYYKYEFIIYSDSRFCKKDMIRKCRYF